MNRKFPDTRLRRLRSNPSLLKITAETSLTVDDLIQPIFVKEGIKKAEAIESMPNVNRYSKEGVIDYCKSLMDLGIKAVALFPVIDFKKKDLDGIEAFNRKNLICGIVESIKKKIPELVLIVDVALDPYTVKRQKKLQTHAITNI
jgi:porphobilinogen synthase